MTSDDAALDRVVTHLTSFGVLRGGERVRLPEDEAREVATAAIEAVCSKGEMVPRLYVDRLLDEQREVALAMHRAYRPEVTAEIAVNLSEESDWNAIAEWCGGTISGSCDMSGEYISTLDIPGVGTAWMGAWIIQRHDRSFAIRIEVDGPSAESAAALAAAADAYASVWEQDACLAYDTLAQRAKECEEQGLPAGQVQALRHSASAAQLAIRKRGRLHELADTPV